VNGHQWQRRPFQFLAVVTILSLLLITTNAALGMIIPFKVEFLLGFVGGLLVFVVWHALLTKGWKRSLLMFTLSFVVAFTAEALGVNYGLIFGHYHYSATLGPGLVGVPFLAALTWEPVLYAAFSITDVLVPSLVVKGGSWLKRFSAYLGMAVIAALATTAWDMMIDPIAVSQGWWVWEGGGSYVPYIVSGVPLTNFMGWLGVSFIITLFYRLVVDTIPNPRRSLYLSVYGPLTLYSSLFLTSFGVSVTVLRRPEVALVGLLAMGPFIAIALTNISLLQSGLAAFQGADGLEIEM
jgi:uncharacterized membrane protein